MFRKSGKEGPPPNRASVGGGSRQNRLAPKGVGWRSEAAPPTQTANFTPLAATAAPDPRVGAESARPGGRVGRCPALPGGSQLKTLLVAKCSSQRTVQLEQVNPYAQESPVTHGIYLMKEVTLGAFLAFATALVYLAGSQFLLGYYQYFGIGFSEIGIEFHETLTRSAQPIISSLKFILPFSILVFLPIAGITALLYRRARNNFRLVALVVATLLAGLVIVTLLYAAMLGRELGQNRARDSIIHLPVFRFVDASTQEAVSNVIGQPPRPVFRHIATTSDLHYVHTEYRGEDYSWTIRLRRDGSPDSVVFLAR